jgi:hypothetical protein
MVLFKPKNLGQRRNENLKHLSIHSNRLPPSSSASNVSVKRSANHNPENSIKQMCIAKLIRLEE